MCFPVDFYFRHRMLQAADMHGIPFHDNAFESKKKKQLLDEEVPVVSFWRSTLRLFLPVE